MYDTNDCRRPLILSKWRPFSRPAIWLPPPNAWSRSVTGCQSLAICCQGCAVSVHIYTPPSKQECVYHILSHIPNLYFCNVDNLELDRTSGHKHIATSNEQKTIR